MNKKVIINMRDEIESISCELKMSNDILDIFSEFVEDEGFMLKSYDEEEKAVASIAFTNRLPTFYSLLWTAKEKSKALADKLFLLGENLTDIIRGENDDADNN